jgi:hypothetical protein
MRGEIFGCCALWIAFEINEMDPLVKPEDDRKSGQFTGKS